MKIRLLKLYSAFFISLFALSGCSSWLDLKPEDKVADEQLYSTIGGFRTALNGIYVDLNNSTLYGGNMLFNTIEFMAQRYDFANLTSDSNLSSIANYEYDKDACKELFQAIWERYYFLIGNCNKLIEFGKKNEHLFFGNDKGLIVGEAYALRAFLHFDLLRLFGPIYATNRTDLSIPYNLKAQLFASELLSAENVMKNVINDLETAKELLKIDPIIEKGPQRFGSEDGLNIETYRTERMNYYAVTGLMARAYLYAELPEKALAAAKEVVAVQSKWFPFIKREQLIGNTNNPDRVFHRELLLGIKNRKRDEIHKNYFSATVTQGLLSPKKYLDGMFGMLRDKDWRYNGMWEIPVENQNIDYKCFHKYEEIKSADYWKDIVPLIRISEMYYIIAETSTDSDEVLWAMNEIYSNRGYDKVEQIEDLEVAIRDEYVKEFFGEGQLFFYYKRKNTPKLLSLVTGKEIPMSRVKYVVPLPASETDFRD